MERNKRFLGKTCSGRDATFQYVTKVIYPQLTDLNVIEKHKETRTVEKIVDLFNNDITNNLSSIGGSLWSAYNAVTQYVDHYRGHSDTRLNQAWFGQGKLIKERALHDAIQLAA